MARRTPWIAIAAAAAPLLGAPPSGDGVAAARDALVARQPAARVALAPATGVARWVRLPHGSEGDLAQRPEGTLEARARAFLSAHRALFGLADPASELARVDDRVDRLGFRHLTFRQLHRGVPVFGALLRAHFDAAGRLRSVNGSVVPGLDLDVAPRVDVATAIAEARAFAASELATGSARPLVDGARLVVYRRGLERPGPGAVHLAWEVGIGGAAPARIFVDAASGKVVDWLPEVREARLRRAYSGRDQAPLDGVPDSFPHAPDWVEGDPFPTGVAELDAALAATADVYARFAALGRDSWDGAGHPLDLSWNRASFCPNAAWNGFMASFCAGFAVHDVVAHEWTHAWIDASADLIYRWQSGALNESFADVFGEALDLSTRLDGVADTDDPPQRRGDGACSGFVSARLEIKRPPAVAGDLPVGLASFGVPPGDGPPVPLGRVVDAGGESPHDGCEPIAPGPGGAWIAFADRGSCAFDVAARHAQEAGAIGVVIGNLPTSPSPGVAPAMSCDFVEACDLAITIPAVSLAAADAEALRAALSEGVLASIRRGANTGPADSVRWLLGEDVRPLGVARDMWAPACLGAPGRVPDPEYACSAADSGGVHTNSGVPNRAFALLVDGGSANGVAVGALGLVRALHVWWRALTVYETPVSDFADHAEALEAACDDLVGAPLADPWGGPEAALSAADCARVAAASLAVELRAEPPCDFERLLSPDAPPVCGDGGAYPLAAATFEAGDDGWTASRRDVASPATFDPRDWTRVGSLPDGRAGFAFFAPDPHNGRCVTGQSGDDDSGVLVLESPELLVPTGRPARLAFDHYVATERDWDGGNLKLSVAGGPWTLVPAEAFVFNPYTGPLFEAPTSSDPLAGEPAFHGLDEGSNAGSWGTSIVDLEGLVAPGQPFRLRFELGTDLCVGSGLGWWVDDVRLVACADPGPLFLDGFEGGDAGRWSALAP